MKFESFSKETLDYKKLEMWQILSKIVPRKNNECLKGKMCSSLICEGQKRVISWEWKERNNIVKVKAPIFSDFTERFSNVGKLFFIIQQK